MNSGELTSITLEASVGRILKIEEKRHLHFALKRRNDATEPEKMLPVGHKSVPKVAGSYPFG
jgi:hypothetical protein